MLPLLKWAGGKRSLVPRIKAFIPCDAVGKGYHEPFVGGGALFFDLEPSKGTINDLNPRLVNFYNVVRDQPEELINHASEYRYEAEEYYARRDMYNSRPSDPVEDAALLLYLNKTCYNGLYRVNSRGMFNVPFGRYSNPVIVKPERVRAASDVLKGIEIFCKDFEYILDASSRGEVVYLDPPYHPVSATANFTDYSRDGFTESDQRRLAEVCVELDENGVWFIQSNSDTEFIQSLYTGFHKIPVKTRRMISSKVDSRNKGLEVLITNII